MYENLFILLLVIVLVCITTRKITEHFQQISNATTFNITANKLSTFNEDKLCVGDTCMKETDIQAIHKHLEKKKEIQEKLPQRSCDSNETINGTGTTYRGCQTKTRSGKTCQKWTDSFPHTHSRTPSNFPDSGIGDHNYCRNPDDDQGGIWCYTTDPNHRWDHCNPLTEVESSNVLYGGSMMTKVSNSQKCENGFYESGGLVSDGSGNNVDSNNNAEYCKQLCLNEPHCSYAAFKPGDCSRFTNVENKIPTSMLNTTSPLSSSEYNPNDNTVCELVGGGYQLFKKKSVIDPQNDYSSFNES